MRSRSACPLPDDSQGANGDTGSTGKTGDGTTVIVTPPAPKSI
jgi:hypothetical protein